MKISYAIVPSDHMSMAKLAGSVAKRLPAAAITCTQPLAIFLRVCEAHQNVGSILWPAVLCSTFSWHVSIFF